MEHEFGDPVTGATCSTCRFWVPRPDRPEGQATIGREDGYCHCHPATLLKNAEDWCGDHELRPGLEPLGVSAASDAVAVAA